jgi:hypothetical protein
VLGVRVFIQQQAIKNWKDDPRGRHELIKAKTPLSGPPEYGLGKFYPSKYVNGAAWYIRRSALCYYPRSTVGAVHKSRISHRVERVR